MPKETFTNLAQDKKERVLDAALTEFAEHTFTGATVSRIVERADIPKGSFYQYFESKKDLYHYIVNFAGEEKFKFMKEFLQEKESSDVFDRLRELYSAGIKFAEKNPRLLAIGQNLIKEDESLKQEIFDQTIPQAEDFLEDLLQEGVAAGDIDPDTDLSVVATIITSYNMSLYDRLLKFPGRGEYDELLENIDKVIKILREGIKA